MKAKTCIRCRVPKTNFYKRKDTQSYRTVCEDCEREYKRQWWLDHPDQNKTYKANRQRGIKPRTQNPLYKRR